MKEAARQGLLGMGSKPLDSEHIQQHLADFGLDAEFSTHSRMRGLSGAPRLCLNIWYCGPAAQLADMSSACDQNMCACDHLQGCSGHLWHGT
jgi:hypothetical protein